MKIRKCVSAALAFMMVLGMTGCGGKTPATEGATGDTTGVESTDDAASQYQPHKPEHFAV